MIKCQIKKDEKRVLEIVVSGHADYAEHGSDIVCAAVSALVITIGNQIFLNKNGGTFKVSENQMKLRVPLTNEIDNMLMETLYNGLVSIETEYKQYIRIEEVHNV
ncbi:MAG: ribosomal-processing cysteine protease Prp [Mycoplasmatales bacterium]